MGCVVSALQKDHELQELYHLIKIVGEGVEGEVWLATCKATGTPAAIKLIPRGEDLGLGPEKVRREIQLQARLSHVNIVELKQVLLTPRHLGIVMTYEEGGDLHTFCNKYHIDEVTARYFFVQIIAALDYCHRHRIAHRDLKLSNFLLTGQSPPRLKLTDFGCAKHWNRKAPPNRLARFRTYAGTPAYMAPQVLESAFYPTHTYSAIEADVWACGILLCHMFFGHHTPFWLEPNAYRSEGATALARIEEMKGGRGAWARSNAYIEKHAGALSEELRDLLDRIFVAEESERITIQGIREHPWFNGPLTAEMNAAIDEMADEQRTRDKTARAAVSTAAGRHDLMDACTGSYATIDFIVKLAATTKRLPGNDRMMVLDMAHLDVDLLSDATALSDAGTVETDASPDAPALVTLAVANGAEVYAVRSARASVNGDASVSGRGDRSLRGARNGGGTGVTTPMEGSIVNGTAHPQSNGGGGPGLQLSLTRHPSGLVTAEYVATPSHVAAASAAKTPRSFGSGKEGGSVSGSGFGGPYFGGSAHGGKEFFRGAVKSAAAAAAAGVERSWHGGPVNDRSVNDRSVAGRSLGHNSTMSSLTEDND